MKNMKFYWKEAFTREPLLAWSTIIMTALGIVLPLLNARLPKLALQGLEEGWGLALFGGKLLLLIAGIALANTLLQALLGYERSEAGPLEDAYYQRLLKKTLHVDYQTLESQKFQMESKAAIDSIYRNHSEIKEAPMIWREFLAALFGTLLYGVMLLKESAVLLIAVLVPTVCTLFLQKKARNYDKQMRGLAENANRRMNYIENQCRDYRAGKDIRIYQLSDWLLALLRKERKKSEGYTNRWEREYLKANVVNAVLCLARDMGGYIYLIMRIVQGTMPVSDFVWYMGLMGTCQQACQMLLDYGERMGKLDNSFTQLRQVLESEDDAYFTGRTPEDKRGPLTVEFRHVCYRYAGSRENTLEDLDFTIKAGEKIALVGLNGAGKTTLIKLLCGLYQPTGGEILVDGKRICEYEKNSYYRLISAVFQNTAFMPLSIAQNVAAGKEADIDYRRVRECLALAGLGGYVEGLPNRERTSLAKGILPEAVELSGGNNQKLWMARALYKDAPLLLLDEPTAALDPLAEQEIYEKYAEMSQGKTSVFISHRLSSTRFCDRILYMEKGRIVEDGSHETLMGKQGAYAKLFELQSQYYKKGECQA